jgi:hypothetical protein
MSNAGNDDDVVSRNVEDGHLSEYVVATSQDERHQHRKPLRAWIAVGVGALRILVLLAILIPTVFVRHDSPGTNTEAAIGSNAGKVSCYY